MVDPFSDFFGIIKKYIKTCDEPACETFNKISPICFISFTKCLQWRIQDFPDAAPTPEGSIFHENCMKMKKFWSSLPP